MTTTETVTAWHGDPTLKTHVIDRLRRHREADDIIQGVYQRFDPKAADEYRGCAIGCTLPLQPYTTAGRETREPETGWHGEVECLYGIPSPVAHLIDAIFEHLPAANGEHAEFAVAVIDAIPVGADLSLVANRFLLDLLVDPQRGVQKRTSPGSQQWLAVDQVAALHARTLNGEEVAEEEWARAQTAVRKAQCGLGASDVWSATEAADYAIVAIVDAADYVQACAEAAMYPGDTAWQAGRLIHHLATAPVVVNHG